MVRPAGFLGQSATLNVTANATGTFLSTDFTGAQVAAPDIRAGPDSVVHIIDAVLLTARLAAALGLAPLLPAPPPAPPTPPGVAAPSMYALLVSRPDLSSFKVGAGGVRCAG